MLFSQVARGGRASAADSPPGPPGEAKNHVFLRILLHLGYPGEPKSCVFTYFAASGPRGGRQITHFHVCCCIWASLGNTSRVFLHLLLHGGCIWLHRGCLGHPGNSWGPSGCAAGRSGALLGTLGHPLSRPWDHTGHLRGPLEPSLGPFWCLLDSLGPSL